MFWRTYWHPEMENIVTMLNSVALVSWSPCDIDQFFSGVNCVMFGGMTQEIVLKTDGSEVFLVFCASELPSGHYWQSLPYYVHAVLLYFLPVSALYSFWLLMILFSFCIILISMTLVERHFCLSRMVCLNFAMFFSRGHNVWSNWFTLLCLPIIILIYVSEV